VSPYLEKQKRLAEWLKVEALSLNPSTAKRKEKKYILELL
jgi:hypothetical protein